MEQFYTLVDEEKIRKAFAECLQENIFYDRRTHLLFEKEDFEFLSTQLWRTLVRVVLCKHERNEIEKHLRGISCP